MKEATGNLWKYPSDAIVITTNGTVKRNGEAVMGRGCAAEAKDRYPTMPTVLGNMLQVTGNQSYAWAFPMTNIVLITMPVKHEWHNQADIRLIIRSAYEIVMHVDRLKRKSIVMPRPGCGNGGLKWEDVKPKIEEILDDRFTAIHYA